MSRETASWLNNNVLIGYTEQRGHAWHYRQSAQGAEPNHYPGAIPIADVKRRLFNWTAATGDVLVDAGVHGLVRDASSVGVYASDTGHVFGYFAPKYEVHQYQDWLLDKVERILDSGLAIGSAGLLKNRHQAWVSIEVPDNITTPEGVEFRPNLLACTSHDGSLKTTYKRIVTNVVCDNTLTAGLGEHGQEHTIIHKRGSALNVLRARDALHTVVAVIDDFSREVSRLCQIDVSEQAWQQFLDAHLIGGAHDYTPTHQSKVRHQLNHLWRADERVEPWRGTAWGVLQAVNTHNHHLRTVRGVSRAERNQSNALHGTTGTEDARALATLNAVLASV